MRKVIFLPDIEPVELAGYLYAQGWQFVKEREAVSVSSFKEAAINAARAINAENKKLQGRMVEISITGSELQYCIY